MSSISFCTLINPLASNPQSYNEETHRLEKIIFVVSPLLAGLSLCAIAGVLFTSGMEGLFISVILSQVVIVNAALFTHTIRKVYCNKLKCHFTELIVRPKSHSSSFSLSKKRSIDVEEESPVEFSSPKYLKHPGPEPEPESNIIVVNEEIELPLEISNKQADAFTEKEPIEKSQSQDFFLDITEINQFFKENDFPEIELQQISSAHLLGIDKYKEIIIAKISQILQKQGFPSLENLQRFFLEELKNIIFCFEKPLNEGFEAKDFYFSKGRSITEALSFLLLNSNHTMPKLFIFISEKVKKAEKITDIAVDPQSIISEINQIWEALVEWRKTLVEQHIPQIIAQKPHCKEYQALLSDISLVQQNIWTFFKGLIGDLSIGEFVMRSHTISQTFNSKPPQEEVREIFQDLVSSMKAAQIDTRSFENNVESYLKNLSFDLESEEVQAHLCQLHVHDLLLTALLLFFLIEHVDRFRPWIAKHSSILIEMISEINIPKVVRHKGKIQGVLKFSLALMKPINGLLSSHIPGKSYLLKGAIWLGVNNFKNWVSAETKMKDHHTELLFQLSEPIISFIVLGVFGSKDCEKKAYQEFKARIAAKYQELYRVEFPTTNG